MIRIEQRGDAAVVWLDRPPVNAMDLGLLRALTRAIRTLDAPVVLTGTGRAPGPRCVGALDRFRAPGEVPYSKL